MRYCYPASVSIGNSISRGATLRKKILQKKFQKNFFKDIKFNNILFKFPKNNYSIKFNLKIRSGEKIGILGESGSGKTTLINLILGLYNPSKGSIYLNGEKIDSIELKNLISYVPQSVYIFDDTILEDITFGNYDKSKNELLINESLKYSKCNNFVNKLPLKLKSKVGEAGSKLSQGQKQRIGIARALYNNSPILVLDEVTSSLDNANANKIINQILKIKNKTIIFSTHKPELLKKFNKF